MNRKINIAINGFGRIGKAVFKIIIEKYSDKINIVAINKLSDNKIVTHLLKYDSIYGKFNHNIKYDKNSISIDDKKILSFAEKDPLRLPWQKLKVDLVLECTGKFRTKEESDLHLQAGAKRVIISAPAKDDDILTVVMGVNEKNIKKTNKIISLASCTTNCLSPVTKIIQDTFGIKKAIMTTIHSYTATQNILDGSHKDLRRSRAACLNIVPTTTGAALATTKVIPELKNKFDGMSMRVPTPVGSLCDIVFITKKKTNEEEVNDVFRKMCKTKKYKGVVKAEDEEIVLADIVGSSFSSIVDLSSTKVVGDDLVKVIVWYDNEWGYSSRLVDAILYLQGK